MRIVVLGGGFGGVAVTRHLERLWRGRSDRDITLVSRDNFFVVTPLLFEACSGTLELRHCAQAIRPTLRRAHFVEATIEDVDVARRVVHADAAESGGYELPYDQLVVALGATTNLAQIPGSEHAFTFKTMADALVLRNHLIERLERADATPDPAHRRRCLTIRRDRRRPGGSRAARRADRLRRRHPSVLSQPSARASSRSICSRRARGSSPRWTGRWPRWRRGVLRRRGADIRASTPVRSIEPGRVHLADETIEAHTIVLAAGIVPNAAASRIPVDRDAAGTDRGGRDHAQPEPSGGVGAGRLRRDPGTERPALSGARAARDSRGAAAGPECGRGRRRTRPCPVRCLAGSARWSRSVTRAPWPRCWGSASTGFVAWWFRRTYYLFQMPRWDRRIRIMLDWTVALFFRPDITKVELAVEQELARESSPAGARTGT